MSQRVILSQVPLFTGLPDDVLDHIARIGREIRAPAGSLIFAEGDASHSLHIVLRGEVSILKATLEVATLGQGECFGELSLLDARPRSATAVCRTDCALFVVEKDPFLDLVAAGSPTLIAAVLATLIDRVRDTTERLFTRELARQTLEARMAAERHRATAEMVAGVAHELNTPLGVANTGVSLIEDALADAPELADHPALEDLREALTLIKRNILRAHALVENFKHVSVGHFVHRREQVALAALVGEVVDLFRIHARRAGMEVEVEDALPVDAQWDGVPGHLTQALTNLLFNAQRHAYPEGGGRLRISLGEDPRSSPPGYTVAVQDFGRGIPEADRPRLFDPFFTTARGEGGSGLGLAIVRAAIEDGLGGEVSVESSPGEGATFTLSFPQVVPDR